MTPISEDNSASGLRHYDPMQLAFQVEEIIRNRMYLRHGITIEPGDVVIDAGANVGIASVMFASCGAAVVHSFEPVGPLYELLCENVRPYAACHPHNRGLSSDPGEAEITFYPRASAMSGLYANEDRDRGSLRQAMTNMGLSEAEAMAQTSAIHGERMRCELTTVSASVAELGLERVDLLKVDVEMAEVDLLRGIVPDDWPKIRQVVAEVHLDQHAAAVEAMLEEHGFDFTWTKDELLAETPVRMVFARRA